MALPKWITPPGNLGIVPDLEYYEFPLDAYDESGGTLIFSLVSGRLPIGLQIVNTGLIKGIPVSELGGDTNVVYRFTIRVTNLDTRAITDRTFNLTITNIAPPIIEVPTPAVAPAMIKYLGLYADGDEIYQQFQARDASPGATLTWTLASGDLPNGLTFTSDGLLYGYIKPIPSPDPGSIPNWDETYWDYLGWEFSVKAATKVFTFTVDVFDGTLHDQSTYSLKVFPRSALTADTTDISADSENLEPEGTNLKFTVDYGSKHNPIIETTQADLMPVRQGSYFSFQITALDIDGDIVNYAIPALTSGSFDEQIYSIANPPGNYITTVVSGQELSAGVFPHASAAGTPAVIRFSSSTLVTLNEGDWISQELSGANAQVAESVINATTVPVYMIQNSFDAGAGNISVNDQELVVSTYNDSGFGDIWANIGIVPIAVSLESSVSSIDLNRGNFINGDKVKVLKKDPYDSTGKNLLWYDATVNSNVKVKLIGKEVVSSGLGGYLTEQGTSANAQITAISSTTGTISLTGAITVGVLTLDGGLITATVGDIITQVGVVGANATVTGNVTTSWVVPVEYHGVFNLTSHGAIKINGTTQTGIYPVQSTREDVPLTLTANAGSYITQTGSPGNALITANVVNALDIPVTYVSGTFNYGDGATAGNIKLNGTSISLHPIDLVTITNISGEYVSSATFTVGSESITSQVLVNGVSKNTYVSSILSVGIDLAPLPSTEGTVGFDEGKFDQDSLALPGGLEIHEETGWITGQLPNQTINEIIYPFEVIAYKRDASSYQDKQLFNLRVLGDLNNTIDWISSGDLGTIENGRISDFKVVAESSKGKTLFYKLTPDAAQHLPQGLELLPTGLISGRVSFEMFGVDQDVVTFDEGATTFDSVYNFTITASDVEGTIEAVKTFIITVVKRNSIPYEDLYLKALPTKSQRKLFLDLMADRSLFPADKIYRREDPFFGLASDIKTLFLPGLAPSTLAEYANAVQQNHYTKRLIFGDIKTALVIDTNTQNFDVKYEVVYIEIKDENSANSIDAGFHGIEIGPQQSVDLTNILQTPYFGKDGNSYTIVYPNSYHNMEQEMVTAIGYANKGALPDWMTSNQPTASGAFSAPLGFTHAVVLAYTRPGASETIAYRLRQRKFDFNAIDFTVDRYQLDNNYSANFDVEAQAFIPGHETTFDRYPRQANQLNDAGSVDYAIDVSFELIHDKLLSQVIAQGGFDGITSFRTGDTVIFYTQEYRLGQAQTDETIDYNLGWMDTLSIWDEAPWDYDYNLADNDNPFGDPTPGILWDRGQYVPGYLENDVGTRISSESDDFASFPTAPTNGQIFTFNDIVYTYNIDNQLWEVANQRAAVWQININPVTTVVTLSLVKGINFYDKLYVRSGTLHSGNYVFFDPTVKDNNTVPNYTVIPRVLNNKYTTFDGQGTRFFDNRDQYTLPESGDKYIKFTKTGVFT
jgi:hypothetical protein